MTAGLSPAQENSMPEIGPYVSQPAEVSFICIYGKGVGDYLNPPMRGLPFCLSWQIRR